jgi:predicted neutral ceramidase superfamily lipid hydrolase
VKPARRQAYLIVLSVVALTLAIIVLALHQNASTDLLAALGIVTGISIAIVSLPNNGDDDK